MTPLGLTVDILKVLVCQFLAALFIIAPCIIARSNHEYAAIKYRARKVYRPRFRRKTKSFSLARFQKTFFRFFLFPSK